MRHVEMKQPLVVLLAAASFYWVLTWWLVILAQLGFANAWSLPLVVSSIVVAFLSAVGVGVMCSAVMGYAKRHTASSFKCGKCHNTVSWTDDECSVCRQRFTN